MENSIKILQKRNRCLKNKTTSETKYSTISNSSIYKLNKKFPCIKKENLNNNVDHKRNPMHHRLRSSIFRVTKNKNIEFGELSLVDKNLSRSGI